MRKTNIEIIKTYFDHFLKGDKEKVFEMLSNEIVWSVKGSDNVPTVGQRKGIEEINSFIENFQANFQPKDFNILYYFEQENKVFAIGNFTHFVIPTQREISSDFMIEFVVEDGKICSYKILEDSYALYLAFK